MDFTQFGSWEVVFYPSGTKAETGSVETGSVPFGSPEKSEKSRFLELKVDFTRSRGDSIAFLRPVMAADGLPAVGNVGSIRSLSLVLSLMGLDGETGLLTRSHLGEDRYIKLAEGSTEGWREYVWINPSYIDEVRENELSRTPLYPVFLPELSCAGIVIIKDEAVAGDSIVLRVTESKLRFDTARLFW
jgi:hypothetical protein